MIIIKLEEMMKKRNISLTELAEKVGITLANMSILKTGKARGLRLSTLNKLCKVLKCKPGELIDYVEDK